MVPSRTKTLYALTSRSRRSVERVVVAAGVLRSNVSTPLNSLVPGAASSSERSPETSRKHLREGVGATGDGLAAAVAVPDAPGLTADGVAAAERAEQAC